MAPGNQLELAEEDVLDAQVAYAAFDAASLDAPATAEDGEPQTRLEMLGEDDPGYLLAEHRVAIGRALHTLPPSERRVLRTRFVEDRTQSEIAAQCGVSQMQVSRILRRTLARVRILAERRSPRTH